MICSDKARPCTGPHRHILVAEVAVAHSFGRHAVMNGFAARESEALEIAEEKCLVFAVVKFRE